MNPIVSDEALHAFVDGELDVAESEALIARIRDDQDLAAGCCVAGGFQTVSLAHVADPNRVILHLDSAAPDTMRTVLDQAERLLDEAEQQGRAMQLEVIANSRGIDLLHAGVSPHAARMARMKQRHANLHRVACGQSIARFANEGEKTVLLPATQTAPTAIGEIVSRLQQGWIYVRV